MKPVLILSAFLLLPAPVALAQEAGGTYVNIGEYTDDAFAPVAAPLATVPYESYETVPLTPYGSAPAPVAVLPETYAAPIVYSETPFVPETPVYSDAQILPAPVSPLPYQAPLAAAPTRFADGAYEAARLAAYDTNRDGSITTGEAIATLRPLTGQ